MEKKCYAKINLSLDSLYKRADGYHEIDSLMTRISLYDKLIINKNGSNKLNIITDKKELKNVKDNLIYKAWALLKDRVKTPGLDIILDKKIPIAAGLAGGSTNCAEMFMVLNDIWDLKLTREDFFKLGKKLGADIPFFFVKKSARARGIGEILTPFEIGVDMKILLINDGTQIASKFVYDRLKDYGHIDNEKIIIGLKKGDKSIVKKFENVMEDVVYEAFPHLRKIRDSLYEFNCKKALLSGSGASIFGIFFDQEDIDNAYNKIKDKYKFVERVSLIDD